MEQQAAPLTALEASAAAQRGITFATTDAVAWVRATRCGACHRGGIPLYGGAIARRTGYTVDNSESTGIGWLARFLANEQQPDGSWTFDLQLRFSKGAYQLYGLAGYTAAGEVSAYLPNVRRGVDWMMSAVREGGYVPTRSFPVPYQRSQGTIVFPDDGLALAGKTVSYVPQDQGEWPVTAGWVMPTAQVAAATAVVLSADPTLASAQREAYRAFLDSLADAIAGQYVRADRRWRLQDLAYGMIGLVAAGRTPASDPIAAQVRDEILSRHHPASGWGDPDLAGDGADALSTGEALYALCVAGERLDQRAAVREAAAWLSTVQCRPGNDYCQQGDPSLDGSWHLPGHTRDIPTVYAALALACYGTLNLSTSSSATVLSAEPGSPAPQTVSFGITLTNNGYVSNTYLVEPSGGLPGMKLSASPATLTLLPNTTGTTTITAELPPNIPPSTVVPITVTTSYSTLQGLISSTSRADIAIGPAPGPQAAPTSIAWLGERDPALAPGSTLTLSAEVRDERGDRITQGSLTFYVGSVAIATVLAQADGAFSTIWRAPSTLQGDQTLSAVYAGHRGSVERSGSSATQRLTVVQAEVPPAPTVDHAPPAVAGTGSTFTGSALTGAIISVFDHGLLVAMVTLDTDGRWSYPVADGSHLFTFTQTRYGLEGPPTSAYACLQWTRPPAVVIESPQSGSTQPSAEPGIRVGYTAQPPGITIVHVTYRLDDQVIYDGVPAGAPSRLDLSWALPGPHTFAVTATNSVGNSGTASVSFTYAPDLGTLAGVTVALLTPLVGTGGLTRSLLHPLLVKLTNARAAVAGGHPDAALGQIGAFTNQLRSLLQVGRIPADIAQVLAADAAWVEQDLRAGSDEPPGRVDDR